MLTVIEELDRYNYPKGNSFIRHFKCICDCGEYTTISLNHLTNGHTESCGCLRIQNCIKACTTHDMSYHPLYSIYYGMRRRCYNKKSKAYINYGGRGIAICKKWLGKKGFENFVGWNNSLPKSKQWKPNLEIDRENNDGNYEPSNCRWVTSKVNSNNRRSNKVITYKGVKIKFKDFWLNNRHPSVTYIAACKRLKKGVSPMKAVSTPKMK